jgi:hypothetical protein
MSLKLEPQEHTCSRFFDLTTKTGRVPLKTDSIDILFIRNDGWAICSDTLGATACYSLYPDSWANIIRFTKR